MKIKEMTELQSITRDTNYDISIMARVNLDHGSSKIVYIARIPSKYCSIIHPYIMDSEIYSWDINRECDIITLQIWVTEHTYNNIRAYMSKEKREANEMR